MEAVVAIAAGAVAGSVALVSFGLDSCVEVLLALAVSWQFAGRGVRSEDREARTLRLVAVAFFALSLYVAFESSRALFLSEGRAETSVVGITLAAVSLVVMPILSLAKRRTGRLLGSAAVVADSTQTLLCTYLSAVLLTGLLLNTLFGWWWADPVAGLVIAAVALREGIQAWRARTTAAERLLSGAAYHSEQVRTQADADQLDPGRGGGATALMCATNRCPQSRAVSQRPGPGTTVNTVAVAMPCSARAISTPFAQTAKMAGPGSSPDATARPWPPSRTIPSPSTATGTTLS